MPYAKRVMDNGRSMKSCFLRTLPASSGRVALSSALRCQEITLDNTKLRACGRLRKHDFILLYVVSWFLFAAIEHKSNNDYDDNDDHDEQELERCF